MKHYFFRIITIAIFALYGISASSETIVQIGNFKYSLNGLYASVYKYVGSESTVTIPESISYNGTTFIVTTIGNQAFMNRNIYELYVPRSVQTIEGSDSWSIGAFKNSSIEKIHLPGIYNIGKYAFLGCQKLKIVDFVINSSREYVYIDNYAFYNCTNMVYIVLPKHTQTCEETFLDATNCNILLICRVNMGGQVL